MNLRGMATSKVGFQVNLKRKEITAGSTEPASNYVEASSLVA